MRVGMALLKMAFQIAAADCPTGYHFRVRTLTGETHEGAPEDDFADGVLMLMNGTVVRVDQIESVDVINLT